jgi:glycosyltransferase involved in cell wall biosynthesis
MSTIHFVHGGTAYLPELAAYTEHLQTLGHSSQIHRTASTVPNDAQVVWWICGTIDHRQAQRLNKSLHIHEYASASVGRLPWLKDRIKQWTHPRPDHRIFQSEWLRQRMGLTDQVPYSLRDMGVPEHFFTIQAHGPAEFDLVYLGAMSRLLAFGPTLHAIDQAGLRLLLIGEVPTELQAQLQALRHVCCTGRIPHSEVPAQLLRAHAGLNLMPPVLPLTEQTSTKLLEYLSLGMPVISNDYPWARRMAQQHDSRIQLVTDLEQATAWHAALMHAAPLQTDRNHLRHLGWAAQLTHLPVWQLL